MTASVTHAVGNKATATDKVTVDEAASLSIKPIDGNGYVNGKNAAKPFAAQTNLIKQWLFGLEQTSNAVSSTSLAPPT